MTTKRFWPHLKHVSVASSFGNWQLGQTTL
jgi:hypothetical protein